MNYLQKRAEKHKVTHEFSGKRHFFKVKSVSGDEYSVSIDVACDCKYMGVQGVSNGEICSHILSVMNAIQTVGNIKLKTRSEDLLALRRRSCLNLVRQSNRRVNEVRTAENESNAHRMTKEGICAHLLKEGKHFVTEAIFETGGRADILVLDDFLVIEIVNTESNESVMRKLEEYPDGIKIKVVRC